MICNESLTLLKCYAHRGIGKQKTEQTHSHHTHILLLFALYLRFVVCERYASMCRNVMCACYTYASEQQSLMRSVLLRLSLFRGVTRACEPQG